MPAIADSVGHAAPAFDTPEPFGPNNHCPFVGSQHTQPWPRPRVANSAGAFVRHQSAEGCPEGDGGMIYAPRVAYFPLPLYAPLALRAPALISAKKVGRATDSPPK